MLQGFDETANPAQGAPRLAALRARMQAEGLAGFIVPRADAHQGEYVAPRDERLSWLTGFTGSAGFAVILQDAAGVFVDGRYRVQVRAQVDLAHYTPVDWPEVLPGPWLRDHLTTGDVGFDPWLHTADEIARLEAALEGTQIRLRPSANLVDAIWPDQPAPPQGRAFPHPDDLAGESSPAKRARLAESLRACGQHAAVITLPDSICWLLNIRGADVPRNPVVQAFAILFHDGRVSLYADAVKFTGVALGDHVTLRPPSAFVPALHGLAGPVRVDRATAPPRRRARA